MKTIKEEVKLPRAIAHSVPMPTPVSGITKQKEKDVSIMRTKMPVAKENVKIIPVQKPHKKVQTKKVSVSKAKSMVKNQT